MILVLVNPALTLFRLDHKLIVSKSSIDESVDESSRQILSRRIDRSSRTSVVQVRFVDIFQRFRFSDGKLFAESLEVFGKFRVVQDFDQGFIFGFDVDLLACENVGELSLHVTRSYKERQQPLIRKGSEGIS